MPADPVYVYVKKENLPTLKEWNQSIEKEGFSLVVSGVNPSRSYGFTQVEFEGETCGFEYEVGKLSKSDLKEDFVQEGGFTHVVHIIPPFDLRCLLASAVAAGTLAWIVQGVLEDTISGKVAKVSAKDSLSWIQDLLAPNGREAIKENFKDLLP